MLCVSGVWCISVAEYQLLYKRGEGFIAQSNTPRDWCDWPCEVEIGKSLCRQSFMCWYYSPGHKGCSCIGMHAIPIQSKAVTFKCFERFIYPSDQMTQASKHVAPFHAANKPSTCALEALEMAFRSRCPGEERELCICAFKFAISIIYWFLHFCINNWTARLGVSITRYRVAVRMELYP